MTRSREHEGNTPLEKRASFERLASMAGRLGRGIVRALIRGYQIGLSPYLPQRCRFYPTCSRYALEAIERHGAIRGGNLAIRRVCKCHPFHPGGVDLVPPCRAGEDDEHDAHRRAENLPC